MGIIKNFETIRLKKQNGRKHQYKIPKKPLLLLIEDLLTAIIGLGLSTETVGLWL